MQVVQTAGVPPNQGRSTLPMTGWTWKSRNALRKMVAATMRISCSSRWLKRPPS
jgi:hypothetical protein